MGRTACVVELQDQLMVLQNSEHATRCFATMAHHEEVLCEEWAVFYYAYLYAALIYELQAAVAAVLYQLPSVQSTLPRTLVSEIWACWGRAHTWSLSFSQRRGVPLPRRALEALGEHAAISARAAPPRRAVPAVTSWPWARMVADCGRDGLLRAAASCRRRCPRRCCLRRAAAGAVGEDAERHDLEAPLVGAGAPTGPSRPRSLAPRCPARVGFLAGPLARNASAPAFALFLAGWAEHLALPAKERPCALGCVPFECVAFLGVLGEGAGDKGGKGGKVKGKYSGKAAKGSKSGGKGDKSGKGGHSKGDQGSRGGGGELGGYQRLLRAAGPGAAAVPSTREALLNGEFANLTEVGEPHVGFAGQRRLYAATNTNGSRLLEVLGDFHMTALNTFGKSTRQNGTWKHTTGKGWATIDFICTRLNGSYGIRAARLRTTPVSMGGYRDHRPVEALAYAGLRAKRAAEPRPDRWNREAMARDLQVLKDPDASAPAHVAQTRATLDNRLREQHFTGHWQEECGEMLCYATPSEYFNAIEHAVIEAAAPHYVLKPTQTQRPKLTDATLALIANKHAIQKRMAYCSDPSSPRAVYLQTQCAEAAKRAAKAVRAERRQRSASTAEEAETADANMNLRKLHSVTRRLAPKPAAPVIAVANPTTGGACMGAEEETAVRAEGLCNIFDGTQINMDSPGGPIGILPRDDARIGTCTVDDVTRAIAKMPNYKSAPALKLPPLGAAGDLAATGAQSTFQADGSVIELWKLCAAETAPVLHGAFQACRALGHAAQRFKGGETVSLRKPKGDGKNAKGQCKAINLINHIGYPTLPAPRPRRASRLGSATVPGMLVAVLIDVEKAFDLIDRDEIWQALEALAMRLEVRLAVEGLHEGTCNVARDIRTNRPIRKLLVPRGVRQGSVEGPMLFVAVYDLLTRKLEESRRDSEFPEITITFDPNFRNLRHRRGLLRGEGEEVLEVSPVKFVDDLIALTIVEDFDAVSRFLEFLKTEITKGKMKVNDTRFEGLIVTTGKQSKRRRAAIRSKRTDIRMQQTPVHAAPSVKYLGTKQRDDDSMVEEGVPRPAFPDLQQKNQPEDSEQGPEDPEAQCDPTKLIQAVVFGRLNFEGPKHTEINSLLGALQEDLRMPWSATIACSAAVLHRRPPRLKRVSQRGPNRQDLPLLPRGKSRALMWNLESAKQWTKPKIDLVLPEDTTELDASDKPQTLRCRLELLCEAAHQLLARDDNFALTVAEGSELEKTLERGYQTTVTKPARGVPHGLQYVTTLWMTVLRKAAVQPIVEDPAQPDQVEQPAEVPISTQIGTVVTKVVRSHQTASLDMVADALKKFMGAPAASSADGASNRIEENQVRWIWAPTIHIDLKYALTAVHVHEDIPELSIQQISAKSALGLLFNTAFATLGFLYLLHAVMPGHLDPFWGSIGAALAAPRRVAGALSSSGLGGLDAAGLGGAWRPMLWGSLWYLTVWRWAVRLCCIRAFMLESLPEWQDMNGLSVFWLYGLYGLLGSTVSLFVAVSALFTTWLKTCPLMRPVWLYLHSCIWALGACLSSERGHAPKSLRLDQCFGLVMLAWYLLAQLLWTPPLGSKFDEEAFLEAVMEKGGFQAKMENRSPSGPLARSLSANPVVRKLSSAILNVEAKDVESKREALKKGSIKSHGGKVALSFRLGPVVREDLLETSLKLLRKASVGQLLSSRFSVHFQGEWGVDWGGLTSDWFDSLAKALVKGSEHRERRKQESDDLFSSSLLARATDGTLLPRPSGYTRACSDAPERLQERWARLAAVGRFLGVAVLKGRPLPLSFGQVLMKLLCARDVSYSDVRHLDDDFYTHRILNAALTEPLTFVSAPTELMPEQVPLKEGGHQTLVTEENKMEYIELLSEARICNGRRHELQFFISGFHEVIPVDVLTRAKVSPAELSLLISGVHEYDVDEWRHHAQQEGDDQVLGWFWEAVASFSTEQRALLLSFSTGSSRIPPGGFENLEPQFRVCTTGEHQDRLPTPTRASTSSTSRSMAPGSCSWRCCSWPSAPTRASASCESWAFCPSPCV
ncbi:unnamed protein product [Prorocentrum cordatum]|uniref:HECT-type E3 ubiquitin transferase n=1 Tax=Prorocentrum cordatum TaxID=2364126 RepID=A0ABN9QG50_9DINO|nr:unnamed protein product [Polarella glacialis]